MHTRDDRTRKRPKVGARSGPTSHPPTPKSSSALSILSAEKTWCATCESRFQEGSDYLSCSGICRRSFHISCRPADARYRDGEQFICHQCQTRQHSCFQCGEMANDSVLRHCSVRSCGKFYHASCWKEIRGTSKTVCGRHQCHRCSRLGLPLEERNPDPVHRCIRCPKSWDLNCVPKGSFRLDFRPQNFLICPDHTPWPSSARLPPTRENMFLAVQSDCSGSEDETGDESVSSNPVFGTFIPFDLPVEWTSSRSASPVPPPSSQHEGATDSPIEREGVESDVLAVNSPAASNVAVVDQDAPIESMDVVNSEEDKALAPVAKRSSTNRSTAKDTTNNPCHFCDRVFKWSHIRNVHERDEHPELCPLHCEKCQAPFHTQAPLDRHLALRCDRPVEPEEDNDEQSHGSASPSKVLASKLRPRRHERNSGIIFPDELLQSTIACSFCSKMFHQVSNLKTHERLSHPEQCPLHCSRCHAGFHSQFPLDKHLLECTEPVATRRRSSTESEHGDDSTSEAIPTRGSNRLSRRETPQSSVCSGNSPGRMFPCAHCDRVFQQVSNLNAHERNQHPEHCPMHCPYCAKPFHSSQPLDKHALTCSSRSAEPALVRRLPGFPIVLRLIGHKKHHPVDDTSQNDGLHEDSKPLEVSGMPCIYCSELFASRFDLHRHLRCSHQDQLPYFCPNCGSGFSGKSSLEAHTIHCSDYVCEECGKEFFSQNSLERHASQKGHNAGPTVQPIVCPICDKVFKWQRSLDNHLSRIHTLTSTSSRKRVRALPESRDSSIGADVSAPSSPTTRTEGFVNIDQNIYVSARPKLASSSAACQCDCQESCIDSSCSLYDTRIECSTSCKATNCKNQRIRQRLFADGGLYTSGNGLSSSTLITEGALIGEFVGEILSHDDQRFREYGLQSKLFRFSSDLVVDGTRFGNMLRFLTVGEPANCAMSVWIVDGAHRLVVAASTTIEPDQPLVVHPSYDVPAAKVVNASPPVISAPVIPISLPPVPSPIDIYDREKLPSQMQFDMVVNYQLEVPDAYASEARESGVYLTRNWARVYAVRVSQAKTHTELGQTIDIAANLASFERLNKTRNRRSISSAEVLRPPPNLSPPRLGKQPDARVVMPAVSLIPVKNRRRQTDEPSSDESSFDAEASAAIAKEIDVMLADLGTIDDVDAMEEDCLYDEEDGSSSVYNIAYGEPEPAPRISDSYMPIPAFTIVNEDRDYDSELASPRSEEDDSEVVTIVNERFQCGQCNQRFSIKSSLKKHLISHGDDNPFRCDTCQLPFLRASDLQRHMTVKKHGTGRSNGVGSNSNSPMATESLPIPMHLETVQLQ